MLQTKVCAESNSETRKENYQPQRLWLSIFILCFLSMVGYGVANSMLPYTMTSIKAEFGLSGAQTGSLVSIFILGQIIGGIIGGWAADEYGRYIILKLCILFSSILLSSLYFSNTYIQFSGLLFLGSLFLGSVYIVSNVLLSEYIEARYRSRCMSLLMIGFILGAIVTALLGGWTIAQYGWRSLYLACALPIFVTTFMHFYTPRNSSWSELKSKKENHSKEMRDKPNQFMAILTSKTHFKFFILWTFCSGALQFGYMGLISWLPTYYESSLKLELQSMTMHMILTYCISIVTKFLAGTMADKWGCRTVFFIGTVGTAISLAALVHYNTPENAIFLIVCFSLMFGIPFGILTTYMVESFPTYIRGTAVGGSFNVGGALTALAPPLIGYYADIGSISTGMLWMAAAYFISGLIALLFIRDRMYDPQNAD